MSMPTRAAYCRRSIQLLNQLITINNDRIQGYVTAAEESEEIDVKELFFQYQQTSKRNKSVLVKEVQLMGGIPAEDTQLLGKMYRVWMVFKAKMTGNNPKHLFKTCEYGEETALRAYKAAILRGAPFLSPLHKQLLHSQEQDIRLDYNRIVSMEHELM